MDCLVLPVSISMRRRGRYCSGLRFGYRVLGEDGDGPEDRVRVVVGKEKKEFLVDPLVLEESPFRVLMEMVRRRKKKEKQGRGKIMAASAEAKAEKRAIFVDVDSILFEHMLWLMDNDCSSLFQLNLREIIDFYAQD